MFFAAVIFIVKVIVILKAKSNINVTVTWIRDTLGEVFRVWTTDHLLRGYSLVDHPDIKGIRLIVLNGMRVKFGQHLHPHGF
jgi:hypothetical protein